MALTTDQSAPGLAETARQAASARSQAEVQSAARQRQAASFQRENGAGARNHTDVTAGQKTGG
jgi:hypothetical protein